jgi:hypothetical protein
MPASKETASVRQNEITVTVEYRSETRSLGVFDTWEGANVTAENTKHRRGGMGKQVAIGGPVTIEDLTVSRDYDLTRDNNSGNAHWLAAAVGRARVTATKNYLDSDGVAFGKPVVITGVLIGYNEPNSDSDSGDVAMYEIVINPDGAVGGGTASSTRTTID